MDFRDLEKEESKLSKQKVLDYIDLLGSKFQYGAKGNGYYDCYNLCKEVYRRIGAKLPEFYSPTERDLIDAIIKNEMEDIVEKVDKPEKFAFVGFTLDGKHLTHMGVIIDDEGRFIHILEKSGVSVERLSDDIWKKKIVGFFRLKEKFYEQT